MSWSVEFSTSARKELRRLPRDVQVRIVAAVETLAEDPLAAPGVKRLGGRADYRLRVGDYRVIYDLDHGVLTVRVIRIGHRREVYR